MLMLLLTHYAQQRKAGISHAHAHASSTDGKQDEWADAKEYKCRQITDAGLAAFRAARPDVEISR